MRLTFVLVPSVRRHKHGVQDGAKTQLMDEQWDRIKDLFPWEPPTRYGGRPRKHPRDCLEGILWVLRSGARWKDLPNSYPSFSTCWRRFQEWTAAGIFKVAWARLLDELGEINWEEAMADGTFSPAKKGRRGRQDQTRQGDQDHVAHRRREFAVGSRPAPPK